MTFASLASEAQLQSAVVEGLSATGWMVYHTYDSRRSAPGFPDIVAVRGDRMLAWELKSAKGRVRAEQAAWIDALAGVPGVDARIVRPGDPWTQWIE